MGNGSSAAPTAASFNETEVLGEAGQASGDGIHEFKVFNIMVSSVALCILTLTCLFCSVTFYRWTRRRKRARLHEATGRERSQDGVRSLLSLLHRSHIPRDNPRVYFIYSNPIPMGEDGGQPAVAEEARPPPTGAQTHTLKGRAKDHSDGIILDPSVFYVQL